MAPEQIRQAVTCHHGRMNPDQNAVDAICREILRIDELHHASQDQHSDSAFYGRLQWDGEIIGLRKALCVLFGWPMEEAQKEGKADQCVEEWMARHPESADRTCLDREHSWDYTRMLGNPEPGAQK